MGKAVTVPILFYKILYDAGEKFRFINGNVMAATGNGFES